MLVYTVWATDLTTFLESNYVFLEVSFDALMFLAKLKNERSEFFLNVIILV